MRTSAPRDCPRSRTAREPTPSRGCGSAAPRLPRLHLVLLVDDLLADLLERTADETRHVHLRDPDLLRDLRLRQSFEEPQMQDPALAIVEDTEAGRQHRAVLRHLIRVL